MIAIGRRDLPFSLVGFHSAVIALLAAVPLVGDESTPAEPSSEPAASKPTPHLGLGIPPDCLAYLHSRGGEQWGPLRQGLGDVVATLESAGVFDEILRTALEPSFREDDKKGLDAEVETWRAIFGTVDWGELFAREVAVGLRFRFPRYELVTLARVEPAGRAALSRGLEDLFEALASLGGDLEVERRERGGLTTLAVRSKTQPDAELCLGGLDDVIAVSTSSGLLRESLQLLRGDSRGWGLLVDDGFEGPYGTTLGARATDLDIYVRPTLYFDQLRLVIQALEAERRDTRTAVAAEKVRRRLQSVIDSLDLVEWAGISGRLDGRALAGDLRLVLKKTAPERAFYPALANQPPLDDVARRVPRQSSSFFAWSGVDVRTFFKKFLALASADAEEIKRVADAFEEFKETNEDVGALVRMAEHFVGSVVCWTAPTPGGRAVDVLRFRVDDADAAKKTLGDLVAELRKREGLALKELDSERRLYSIASPLEADDRLSFGIDGGDLVVVTAGGDVALKAFRTATGAENESIASRFTELGIPIDGPRHLVLDVSFERFLGRGREILGVAALLGKILSADQEPTRAVPLASSFLARLGPALDALGFLDRKLVSIARKDLVLEGRWAVTFARKKEAEKKEEKPARGEKKKF